MVEIVPVVTTGIASPDGERSEFRFGSGGRGNVWRSRGGERGSASNSCEESKDEGVLHFIDWLCYELGDWVFCKVL